MHIFCLNASIFDDFGNDRCSILHFFKFVLKKIIFKTRKKKTFLVFFIFSNCNKLSIKINCIKSQQKSTHSNKKYAYATALMISLFGKLLQNKFGL